MSKFKEVQNLYLERLTVYKNIKIRSAEFIRQFVDKIVTNLEWPTEKVSYIDSIDSKSIPYPAQESEIEQILTLDSQGFWKFRLELELPLEFGLQEYPVVFTISILVGADKKYPESQFCIKIGDSKEIFERLTIDNRILDDISNDIFNKMKAIVDKKSWDTEQTETIDLDKI